MAQTVPAIVVSLLRPVGTCLVAGALKTLYDYQATQRWGPALVDGGITLLVAAAAWLGWNGAAAGIGAARTKA
ncbi:MAG TPA: hypothetical protein VJ741_09720 [Solirubrobacteraceae bacterium]|nr:hypothetical protein [Solirubrobacteraceae bacterium]